ncbi:DUF6809 family protein [Cellulosilyticum sp. I15G10I2]|uniref:DUF6809 family protein n=1 Tax=Cellulosilyticum sp. I15G10I2 TaxID=1892843 RepID=UPI00085CDA9E|nr:DUF6809 family protein [Cellulosilyticum sp. I15G10I2]
MKTLLEELYNGNIFPDGLIISNDSAFRPLNKQISEAMEKLKNKLSENDFRDLEALLNLRSESSSMEATASFVYGFKLGATLLIEVLTGKENLIRGED